jgi:methyl-accepting chemotaxis protein
LNANLAKDADLAAKAKAASVRNLAIAAMVVAILASIGLAFVITNSITTPLAQSVKVAEAVAEGDLTSRTEIRGKDELAQLLGSVGAVHGAMSARARQLYLDQHSRAPFQSAINRLLEL